MIREIGKRIVSMMKMPENSLRNSLTVLIASFFVGALCLLKVWSAVNAGEIVFRGYASVEVSPLGFWFRVSAFLIGGVFCWFFSVFTVFRIWLRKRKSR